MNQGLVQALGKGMVKTWQTEDRSTAGSNLLPQSWF
jgi:hypothetical protein